MVNVIAPYYGINGRMKFDTAYLSACEIMLIVNMMDMVVLNDTENTAKMSYNTRLTTVMDIAASNDMRADALFIPSFIYSLTYAISLSLASHLYKGSGPLVVIASLEVLAKRYSAAL